MTYPVCSSIMSARRVVIFGNSGSGKSTLAKTIEAEAGLVVLELDSVAWAPGQVGIRRDLDESFRLLDHFIREHPGWIIEGCYATLVERASKHCTELLFLDPGIERCLQNNRGRPWEPHKYATKAEQDKHLDFLQDWVRQYHLRSDEYSHREHQRIFDTFAGVKRKIR